MLPFHTGTDLTTRRTSISSVTNQYLNNVQTGNNPVEIKFYFLFGGIGHQELDASRLCSDVVREGLLEFVFEASLSQL